MRSALAAAMWVIWGADPAQAAPHAFRFQDEPSLERMQARLRVDAPPGATRAAVRAMFVDQGHATLKLRPGRPQVEKYLYDIDLCGYYVWRWNISADFDGADRLVQLYVNGEPALPGPAAPFGRALAKPGAKAVIVKISRARPEAYKGERTLTALVADFDGDLATIDDQELIGGGPTRADAVGRGTLHIYHVDPCRSIFDGDAASRITPWDGDCAKADAAAAREKGAAGR